MKTLETMMTKASRKVREPEPSSEEEDATDDLTMQLAKLIASAQKKEASKKSKADF